MSDILENYAIMSGLQLIGQNFVFMKNGIDEKQEANILEVMTWDTPKSRR